MDLSIVTTLYGSASYLEEFGRRIKAVADRLTDHYEILLVNDGSPDNAQQVALELQARDPRIGIIELSRNFGHHKAMMTGMAHAKGNRVFIIDCDLEEAPELLGEFYREFEATEADVVYGIQQQRKGGWVERCTGRLFYWLFNLLSSHPIPTNLVTARLMRRQYVRALLQHREREVFVGGLLAITGFKQVPLPICKHSRQGTSYSLVRRFALLVNAITSFSAWPLVFIFYLGCGILALSGAAGGYLILRKLFFGELLLGWASLMVSIWFLGGLSIFCLGIIGIYLSKIFMETKRRPYTIIKSFLRPGQNAGKQAA